MEKTFVLQPLWLQNAIMAMALLLVLFLLFLGIVRKNRSQIVVFSCWVLMVLWFFNGPLWGFSTLRISRQEIVLNYGWLCFLKKEHLPLDTPWRIRELNSGFPRYRKLYLLEIGKQKSMRVDSSGYARLQEMVRALCLLQNNRGKDCPRGSSG